MSMLKRNEKVIRNKQAPSRVAGNNRVEFRAAAWYENDVRIVKFAILAVVLGAFCLAATESWAAKSRTRDKQSLHRYWPCMEPREIIQPQIEKPQFDRSDRVVPERVRPQFEKARMEQVEFERPVFEKPEIEASLLERCEYDVPRKVKVYNKRPLNVTRAPTLTSPGKPRPSAATKNGSRKSESYFYLSAPTTILRVR